MLLGKFSKKPKLWIFFFERSCKFLSTKNHVTPFHKVNHQIIITNFKPLAMQWKIITKCQFSPILTAYNSKTIENKNGSVISMYWSIGPPNINLSYELPKLANCAILKSSKIDKILKGHNTWNNLVVLYIYICVCVIDLISMA